MNFIYFLYKKIFYMQNNNINEIKLSKVKYKERISIPLNDK